MKDEDVTAQIMDAWDEVLADDEKPEADEPEADAATVVEGGEPPEPGDDDEADESEEEAEEEAADEEADEDAAEDEEGEEEEGDEAAQEEEATPEPDVEVQAFLAKYGGDEQKALKAAADLQRVLGRQGSEKAAALERVAELERELAQARALGASGALLNEEQRAWVETAAESLNPAVYVQQAVQAGEFELARAVCREWAQTNPFDAQRIGQFVDASEAEIVRTQNAVPEVPPTETWAALADHYPELRQYEAAMVETLGRLGPDHPSVQEARSTDPNVAVRGIMHIFDVAKASTFALSDAKAVVKKRRRKEADDAADNAVVTSGAARPSTSQTPRPRQLMPGLTEEALDAAFEAEFARQ